MSQRALAQRGNRHATPWRCHDQMPLPSVLNCGAVLGYDGYNAQWIIRESGGGLYIQAHDGHVFLSAKDETVIAKARQLLQDQFAAAVAYGSCAFPHPKRVDCVLLGPFGTAPRATLAPREDTVTAAIRKNGERLYQLVPFRHEGTDAPAAAVERAVRGLALSAEAKETRGHRPREKHPTAIDSAVNFYTNDAAGMQQVAAALSASAHAAAAAARARAAQGAADADAAAAEARDGGGSSSGGGGGGGPRGAGPDGSGQQECSGHLSTPKPRLQLGKQLHYKVDEELWRRERWDEGLGLEQLQAACAKHKKVFSNVVTASQYEAAKSWLGNRRGFRFEGCKETASIGVLNRRLNVKYDVSLDLSRSPAAIRKVRLPPQRIHFVSFLGSPQLPDLRLKLLVNGRNLQGDPAARHVAEELAKSVSARGFEAAAAEAGAVREAVGPDIQLEQAVRKSKEAADGSAHQLKLTLTRVQTATRDCQYRISATLPAADQELRSLLQHPREEVVNSADSSDGGRSSGGDSGRAAGAREAKAGAGGSGEPGGASETRGAAVGGRCSGAWAEVLVRAVCTLAEQLGEAMRVQGA